jgi:hypothetical protein
MAAERPLGPEPMMVAAGIDTHSSGAHGFTRRHQITLSPILGSETALVK